MQELIHYSDYQLAEFYHESFFMSPNRLPKDQEETLSVALKEFQYNPGKIMDRIKSSKCIDHSWVLKDILKTLDSPITSRTSIYKLYYHFGVITGRFSFINDVYE
jgi:hypothetical protein